MYIDSRASNPYGPGALAAGPCPEPFGRRGATAAPGASRTPAEDDETVTRVLPAQERSRSLPASIDIRPLRKPPTMARRPVHHAGTMSRPMAVATPESATAAGHEGDLLARALAPGAMISHFQPIFSCLDGSLLAHEGLMRLKDRPEGPLDVLAFARRCGRLGEVETLAARTAAVQFDPACAGLVFINLSSHAILQGAIRPQQVLDSLSASALDLSRFVIELTERDIVEDAGLLAEALAYLRARGIRLALDDFGNGHSNFELWHELAPEFVKIDRFLIDGIASSASRLAIVKALIEVAASLGSELIAEGLEQERDLLLVRDLGIAYGQGYLLGRPSLELHRQHSQVIASLEAAKVPVRPMLTRFGGVRQISAAHLLVDAPALSPQQTNHEVEQTFRRLPELHALAVVNGDGEPIGIINRREFTERMVRPFARELLGRKPCTELMHGNPIVCDVMDGITDMADILRGEDQRYLADGFVITEGGRYRGLGTGEALVRRVTELRIEAARYANPLTLLPGNIPIKEHIERLLDSRRPFVAAYGDLNHFKPFNDQYGYFRGDRMIRLAAELHVRNAEPNCDFVGHVGGDDFVVLFQSEDWLQRCTRIVDEFQAAARHLFDAEDLQRGVLMGEDRAGRPATFPLTTLCIGVVHARPGVFREAEEVASLAATAKRRAKRDQLGVHLLTTTEVEAIRSAAT